MRRLVISRTANRDIEAIWQYIAQDSTRHADLVEEAIYETCYLIGRAPGIGHPRPGTAMNHVLFVTVAAYPRYVIAYSAKSQPPRILRVLHGARNIPTLFR